jgi:uncharacterized protein (DUF885 family)
MTSPLRSISRRRFLAGASSFGAFCAFGDLVSLAASEPKPGQSTIIDNFFGDFTAEWVRRNPNLATARRYFTGDGQDRLERQLTPETVAWRKDRIRLARQGVAGLRKFDHARMTEAQRVSADLMEWQLDVVIGEEPYLDYTFPLEQFNGANVRLPNQLTVVHPLLNEKDAENYVAALTQVSARMQEAAAESRRLAAKGIIPPRFILQSTIKQMQSFIGTPPGQNPFVTTFTQRMAAVTAIPEATREQLRAEAEKIVGAQVYPAWMQAAALLESQSARATDDAGLWHFKAGSRGLCLQSPPLNDHHRHGRPNPRNRTAACELARNTNGRSLAPSGPYRGFGEGPHRQAPLRSALSQSGLGRKPQTDHGRHQWNP